LRVLLDESVPRRLKSLLPHHDVSTAQEMGWAGIDNGALLRRASEAFAAFVTADRWFEHQQNLADVGVGVVLLIVSANRFEAYVGLAEELAKAVETSQPGELIKVGA